MIYVKSIVAGAFVSLLGAVVAFTGIATYASFRFHARAFGVHESFLRSPVFLVYLLTLFSVGFLLQLRRQHRNH